MSARKKVDYRPWGSSTPVAVTLTDDAGNSYRRVLDSEGSFSGQLTDDEVLYPGESVSDLLVFEPPVDGTEVLFLQLSGSNVGGDGYLRFSIAGSSIRRQLVLEPVN